MNKPILSLESITRTFRQGKTSLEVLRGVTLTLEPGEICALVGSSGSGKSTLLQIAGITGTSDSGGSEDPGRAYGCSFG